MASLTREDLGKMDIEQIINYTLGISDIKNQLKTVELAISTELRDLKEEFNDTKLKLT